ncbi:MAG: ImmA/IrrE family metallo-endopeptidase [Verrucomicrobiota bacterium]
MNITLQPAVLRWARLRAGLSEAELGKRLTTGEERVKQWETDGEISYKRAEKLAASTHTPFGYLFLAMPPEERLPIPDLRTVGSQALARPSPDLLDVIYQSQRRQEWFREHQIAEDAEKLAFVGSTPVGSSVKDAAAAIRSVLRFHPSESLETQLDGVLRDFCEAVEAAGILVVRTGTVGNNTRRTLKAEEFRGFALVDDYAPLVLVNAADFKAAQIFTLAHELAHIWAGEPALSNLENSLVPEQARVEWFCNAVAAEYLIPLEDLKARLKEMPETPAQSMAALRRHYRVSDLVVIRRLHDAGEISREEFKTWYEKALNDYASLPKSAGGDFYRNQPNKLGRRFAGALIASTLEGKTLYRDAMALLDLKKLATFQEVARNLNFTL